MNPFWQNLITNVSWGALIIGGISWVLRRFIDHFFSNKIEQYKAELERENTKFKITYEKLHTERAEVIKNVYKKIVKTDDAFLNYIKPMRYTNEPTQDEYAKIAGNAFNDLSSYYRENRIFFTEAFALRIDKILDLLLGIANQFQTSRILREENSPNGYVTEWGKAFDRLKNEVPPLKTEIEKEFRTLIGI